MLEWKDIKIYPEWVQDFWKYILVLVLLCAVSKIVFDLKENRRHKKEFAEYMQRKTEEE